MAGNPFVGDSGPAFDPENPPEVAQPVTGAGGEELLDIGWQAPRLKRILRAQGIGTHELIGVGEQDWLWKPSELDAISEPLADVLNRYPTARAAAAVSDELTIGAVMLEHSLRSIRERRRVLKARQALEEQQPPPRHGPEVPLGYPRAFDTGYRPEDVGAEPAQPINPVNVTDPEQWRMPE